MRERFKSVPDAEVVRALLDPAAEFCGRLLNFGQRFGTTGQT
ncbi:MAG TPA: hypothetical protein VFB21_07975 [Chthonomonadaceae bacterium]|nr:hypothetical protein [Chthonomonadaceae bacterium]